MYIIPNFVDTGLYRALSSLQVTSLLDPKLFPNTDSIKLLYDSKYPMVVLDAEKILTEYTDEHTITLSNLSSCRMHLDYAPNLDLADEEKEQAFVIRNGELFLVVGNGKTYINSVNYDEGWTPPQKIR